MTARIIRTRAKPHNSDLRSGVCRHNAGGSTPDRREVRLFKTGRNQVVRIPVGLELPGETALMHREGNRLVIQPERKSGLLALLATLEPISEDFPDFDADLLPAGDVPL